MTDALVAIADLRHVAARLERSADPALRRHAAALRAYEAEAAAGMTLDRALGVSQTSGGGAWWSQEARAARDSVILELRKVHFADCAVAAAAAGIAQLAERRRIAKSPPVTARETLVDAALRTGVAFPRGRRLRTILAGNQHRE